MVYDRAALTALPEDIRHLYVAHLKTIVAETTKIFLLTTEDAEENDTSDQILGVAEEIKALYSRNFNIDLIHVESIFEDNPELPDNLPERTEYKVYRLSKRSEY
jgi:thiopurine S-methyltransferase